MKKRLLPLVPSLAILAALSCGPRGAEPRREVVMDDTFSLRSLHEDFPAFMHRMDLGLVQSAVGLSCTYSAPSRELNRYVAARLADMDRADPDILPILAIAACVADVPYSDHEELRTVIEAVCGQQPYCANDDLHCWQFEHQCWSALKAHLSTVWLDHSLAVLADFHGESVDLHAVDPEGRRCAMAIRYLRSCCSSDQRIFDSIRELGERANISSVLTGGHRYPRTDQEDEP